MRKVIYILFLVILGSIVPSDLNAQFQFEGFWEIQKWYVKITKVSNNKYYGVSTKKKNGLTDQAFEYEPHFTIEIVKDRNTWFLYEHRTTGETNTHKIKLDTRKPDEFKAAGVFGSYKRVNHEKQSLDNWASQYPKMKVLYDRVNDLCEKVDNTRLSDKGLEGEWSISSTFQTHSSELTVLAFENEYYSCVTEDFNLAEKDMGGISSILKFKPTAYSSTFLVEYYLPEIGEYIGSRATVKDGAFIEFDITYSADLLNKIDKVQTGGLRKFEKEFKVSYNLIRLGNVSSSEPSIGNETVGNKQPKGFGTGFLLSEDGKIATNYHVIEGCKTVEIIFPHNDPIRTEHRQIDLLTKDANNDLAILELNDMSSIDLSDLYSFETNSKVGENVFVIGYPQPSIQGTQLKITDGLINSNSGLQDNFSTMQISVPIQPGNSGSPLFNSSGKVVGVVSSTLNPAVTYRNSQNLPQNVNYAVKASILNTMTNLGLKNEHEKQSYSEYFEKYKKYIGIVICY